MKIKLFGNNVMLEQRQKEDGVKLHLPSGLKKETLQDMCDVVVIEVGDAVTRVKVGDKIIIGGIPPQCSGPHPLTGEPVYTVQEGMIQGVITK